MRLQGADNFRSLKGLPAYGGRRIAGDTLLRADQLHRLTVEDWMALQQMGLKTVCDLRAAPSVSDTPVTCPKPSHGMCTWR